MKKTVLLLIILQFASSLLYCQITSPVIRANFGVDADLRSNYFNNADLAGNDDWFTLPGSLGTGQFIIDTTGAAAIVARYATDIPFRRSVFSRTMRYPVFSVINNSLLLDAVFVRDFHGDDSTVFASGGNKNGDNPGNWTCPVSQGIPDKNDILDMMVHVRRAGPNNTDSLWMMGAVSLDNTSGNRYFDFEMYQTNLTYDRATRKFYNYGPDDGHTSWEFDAAGNVTKAGDIIFSAEYQSASLTLIEARIWVNQSAFSIVPAAFSWGGQFAGASAGAQYGYASIQPNGSGAYYTGMQCGDNTWGGPFSIILQDESVVTNYAAKQFVEFSVNLTKLGLDPITSLGGDVCGMPFRRILVKTRASASFTAELKDFVAPFAFANVPVTDIATATPFICNQGSVAEIHVTNPLSTSTYQWTTPNGSIISGNTGPSIIVDTPGIYIVTQHLQPGCATYSSDTIVVSPLSGCFVLSVDLVDFRGKWNNNQTQLDWKIMNNQLVQYFEVQRSLDGNNFITIDRIDKQYSGAAAIAYAFSEDVSGIGSSTIFYRVKLITTGNTITYSPVINLSAKNKIKNDVIIFPNPVKDIFQLQLFSMANTIIEAGIFDLSGKQIKSYNIPVQKGNNGITLDGLIGKPPGIYMVLVNMNDETFRQKVVLLK